MLDCMPTLLNVRLLSTGGSLDLVAELWTLTPESTALITAYSNTTTYSFATITL